MAVFAGAFAAGSTSAANTDGSGFESQLEYLYVDANEDNASGGHVALRLGDDVFHFQYEDGLLRIHQDRWRDFDLRYRGLQNRNIQATRVEVSADTLSQLQRAFRARFVGESRQFALLAAARADATTAAALAGGHPVAVSGIGFFPDLRQPPPPHSALPRLSEAASREFGEAFFRERRARLREELRTLAVQGIEVSSADFRPGSFPRPHYSFAERYADLVAGLHALDVLEHGAALSASQLRWLTDDAALSASETRALERTLAEQVERLVRLARGTRPDWGPALLLGMARLEAMQRSLARGRWALLDALPASAPRIEISRRQRGWLPELEAEARRDFESARRDFRATEGEQQSAYARLEADASRWLELQVARSGAPTLRVQAGPLVPQAPAAPDVAPLPGAIASNREKVALELASHERVVESLARVSLAYDLTGRNCVSELFATIESALATAAREESGSADPQAIARVRLGGAIPHSLGASIVPFVSAQRVQADWRVGGTRLLPSLRRARVADMKSREHPLGVALRESNTLTARAYARGGSDSLFLFFTDQAGPTRPLLGLGNLLFALAGSAVGVVSLPADRGETLVRALSGALFSLPELLFQNVRKGTNEWLPSSEREWLRRSEGQRR